MDVKWQSVVKNLNLKDQWKKLYDIKKPSNYPGLWAKGTNHKYEHVLIEIEKILKIYNIKTMTDCGCGNFFWMNKLNFGETKYLGCDIVDDLIIENKKKYPDKEFRVLDLTKEIPPKSDLLFIRSVFVHLENKYILSALENIKKSGSKYLLTSFSPHLKVNEDTSCIMLRKINLLVAPFNFPKPVYNIEEVPGLPEVKCLGLWEVKDL